MKFELNGDSAIGIKIGDEISVPTSQNVHACLRALQEPPIEGVTGMMPAYATLMIHYEPDMITYDELIRVCKERLINIDMSSPSTATTRMVCEIPILYGGEDGQDIETVAKVNDKSIKELIDIHSSHECFTYIVNHVDGQAFMGSDNGLKIPRRADPLLGVKEGSLIIIDDQSIILPDSAPTGWYVIGRTPIEIFDLGKEDPFLHKVGTWVKFRPIDKVEFNEIKNQVEAGTYQCKVYVEEGS